MVSRAWGMEERNAAMLFPASQKARITRGAGQDDPGFMDFMNRPGFWTVSKHPP